MLDEKRLSCEQENATFPYKLLSRLYSVVEFYLMKTILSCLAAQKPVECPKIWDAGSTNRTQQKLQMTKKPGMSPFRGVERPGSIEERCTYLHQADL